MSGSMGDGSLGLAEAAARLRIPYQLAHRLVLIGRLSGQKTGGRWRVTLESLRRVELEESKKARD